MSSAFPSGFSPAFRERNRDALESIESGPSFSEVAASGFRRGLTAGNVSEGSGSSGLGESADQGIGFGDVARGAGRVLEGIATLGTSELHRARRQQQAEQDQLQREEIEAQIRQQNLANAAQALGIASDLARNVGVIDDPDQRAAVRSQAEQTLANDAPGLVPLFRALTEHQAVAHVDQEQQLANVAKHSKTAQAWMTLSGADPSKLTDEVIERIVDETELGQSREFIAKGRPIAKRLVRRFEEDNPQRAQQMRESDRAITTDEFAEIVSTYQSSEPDISNPDVRANLIASVRRFPDSYGFKPQEVVERRRELVERESVEAAFRDSPRSDAVNVLLPSGERRIGRETADGQLLVSDTSGRMVPAPSGAQIIGTTITGTAEEVLPGADEAGEAALSASARIADATRLLGRLNRGGAGMAGVRGVLTENVAGAIAQVNESLGEMTAQAISGTSLQELQAYQTEARRMVAQSVAELVGEESGRITDRERQLAQQASTLVEPGKSFQQTRAGLVTLQKLAVVAQDRSIIEAGGTPTPLDTEEQKRSELRRLVTQLSMSPADSAETVRSMMKMREQLDIAIRGIQGNQGARSER